ncbi:MAG: hypothetical protein WD034_03325 [Parvibaculum sp.]|uniref:hypothetical protein n=1 Tax=Parvibaculum sp. TaxID=2024848 RepID=UPI0034A04502
MTRFTKTLLAGTASIALLASPALAADPAAPGETIVAQGTGNIGIDGTMGGESAAQATGTIGADDDGAVGTGAAGTEGTVGAGSAAGTIGTTGAAGTAMDMTGSPETTGSLGSPGTDPAILLTQRGYTDIELAETDAIGLTGHATYRARNSAGKHVELVVDPATGDILRENTRGAKN